MPKYLNLRLAAVAVLLLLSPIFLSSVKTNEPQRNEDDGSKDRWEYLVVANPSRTNFTPTGNSRMRKEEMGGFGVEAFVLEQHMDKLGANGWELVAVSGNPNDAVYYFKRPKTRRD
jgi:hypothetical protein